jgi:hypothetical protein
MKKGETMSTLLDLIKSQLTPENIQSMAGSIGANPQQTNSAITQLLPVLVGAVSQQANTNTGLSFLTMLLDKNKDGSVVDDILRMVMGGDTNATSQGELAINALLGSKTTDVQNQVAQSSGIDVAAIAKLLPMLAPLVMGALAKAQASQNLSPQGLQAFLEKESTSAAATSPESQSLISSLLDSNKDGSVVDDVLRLGAKLMS